MLKTMTTAAFAFCVGALVTLMWVRSEAKTRDQLLSSTASISIEDLQAKIGVQDLPDREIREPF